MGIIDYLDYIGVVAFAVSGAVTAIKKRMDYFGILVLAMVTAIGGGVIRDIIIKDGLPTFFLRYEYTLLICATTALVILTKGQLKWAFALDIFDALGLATFTVEAGLTALNMGLNFITFSFVSLITAVGGGVVRDVFSREIPRILRQDVYAVASIAGSTFFWFLRQWIPLEMAAYISIGFIFVLRLISIRFQMRIPTVQRERRTPVSR
ncbi:trimeric intracellular cation channel family protein [Bittarella sp. HCP28S3_D9]|uniref:trimeric intracellular cation channel family protein n=1 Tax=Bittarella sp. HCP28S3_D9 TaxID=3440253 RepID=UPI003F8A421F